MTDTGLGRRSEALLETIRERIGHGEYAVGDKLPGELALCAEFGVSRSTVRRSLARLAEEGLVRSRQGSGTIVCATPDRPAATRTIAMMYNFDGEDLTSVQDYALTKGYLLCVYSQRRERWNLLAERSFMELVLRERHAALLAFCSPLEPRNDDRLMRLADAGVRVVHIEHYRHELPAQGYLLPDYRLAGRMAVEHLREAGYERMLYVEHNVLAPFSQLIGEGVEQAWPEVERFRLPPAFEEDLPARQALAAAVAGQRRVGVIGETAGIARLVRQTLTAAGIRTPDEVGVVGTELVGPIRGTTPVDTMVFDRASIIESAIDAAVGTGSLPRSLVAPRVICHGSTTAKSSRRER